jgi:hypothetical protein
MANAAVGALLAGFQTPRALLEEFVHLPNYGLLRCVLLLAEMSLKAASCQRASRHSMRTPSRVQVAQLPSSPRAAPGSIEASHWHVGTITSS